MMKQYRALAFALSLALSAALAARPAQAAWTRVSPPEGGFSVSFPAPAEKQVVKKEHTVTQIWLVRTDGLTALAGVTDYDVHIDTERELTLDMQNFLKAMEGTVGSQKRGKFTRTPAGALPSLDFTFVTSEWTGESIIVVDGDRAYQLVVMGRKGQDRRADIAHVLNSYKITASGKR